MPEHNRFLTVLNRPVIWTEDDIEVTEPDPDCGVRGKRCSDYPCEGYNPVPDATYLGLQIKSPGDGDCDSDGHYLCNDCTRLSNRAIEWRQNPDTW